MSKLKILIVDDDPDILVILKLELKKSGFEPIACSTVSDALIKLKEGPFECALLDIVMGPNKTSDSLVKFMTDEKENKLNLDLPIILISAHVNEELRLRMMKRNPLIVDVLQKNIIRGKITEKLNAIFKTQTDVDEELDIIFKPFSEEEKKSEEEIEKEKKEAEIQRKINLAAQALEDAGLTPLMFKCLQGNYNEVLKSVENEKGIGLFQINKRDGKTLLHYAAKSGNTKLAALLIEKGLKINERDHHRTEPLYEAIKGQALDMCRYLIKEGARINSKVQSKTYLMICAQINNFELFSFFLKQGVNPKFTDDEGKTVMAYLKPAKQQRFIDLLK